MGQIASSGRNFLHAVHFRTCNAAGRRLAAVVPASGSCLGKPCWKAPGNGFKYSNAALTPDGVKTMALKPGPAGKSRVVAKGRGQSLALPPLPLATPVTVDLVSTEGRCWGARYTQAQVTTAQQFKGKSE